MSHKYTQYIPDSTYWDKRSREIEAEVDARTEPGDKAVSWDDWRDMTFTWVGENGWIWVFHDELVCDEQTPGLDK
jgi:hypothetical protein